MTSLLFRVISAHRCRSTHHHIAIGALTLLKGEHAQRWHDLMLVMHDDLLKGAKAPDAEFKDFKNHVLHIEEGEWGGARDAALEWYAKSVMALKAKKWSDAAYALGVMSHYYADPIQPFHTGQTEEEGAIHRAVEWSIAKSRPEIARRIETKGYPVVPTGEGPGFVSDMVRAGAEKSHPHYNTLLDHYNVDAGVKVPEDGLDDTLLDVISDLVAYATSGLAAIYMRAFEEAGVAPPKSNLSINGFLATLDIPIRWITSKLEDANDRRIVTAMYEELRKTGKVIKKLPDDDKQIRKMHAQQVLRIPLKELDAQRMRKIGEKHVARAGATPVINSHNNAQTEAPAQPAKVIEEATPVVASAAATVAMADTTITTQAKDASSKIDKKAERLAIKEAKQAEKQRIAQEKADAKERAKAEKAAAAQAKIEAAANAKAEKVAALQAKADEEARIKAEEKASAEKAATEKAEAAKQARAEANAKKEAEERAAAQAKAAKQAEKDSKRKNRGQTDCDETAEAAALLTAAHKTAAQREAEQREAEQRAAAAAEASAPEAKQQTAKSTNTEPQPEKPKYRVKTTGEHSESKSKEYDEAESAFAAQLKQVSKGTRFEPVENDPDEDMDVTTYDAMIDAMDDDDLGLNEDDSSETVDYEDTAEEDTYASSRTSRREPLSNESPIVDAPSIGKKTAARMRNVGIHTVGDFVQAKAKDLSAKLGGGYMTPATLIDWQDQALLMIDMPSLRVHDAQILVGAGVRCVEDLAESSSRDLFASAVSFLKTKDGARIAQNGNALDHEEVYDWIEEAQAAFA